jgi:uncharacterized protein YndB with AHSA1/START domain
VSNARAADVPRLEIRKTIHASREAVFRALTTPDSIKRWFSSPKARTRHVEIEPRLGGKLVVECEFAGGVWRLDGVIREFDPPRKLGFTWVTSDINDAVGSVVSIELTEKDGRTDVVLCHEGFQDLVKRREKETGWIELLSNLAGEAGGAA